MRYCIFRIATAHPAQIARISVAPSIPAFVVSAGVGVGGVSSTVVAMGVIAVVVVVARTGTGPSRA